jgi:hypothetical protein
MSSTPSVAKSNVPSSLSSRISPTAKLVTPTPSREDYAKVVTGDFYFKSYSLTQEEEFRARAVPEEFAKLLHTFRTEVAIAKLQLKPAPGDTQRWLQDEAILAGQLMAYQVLINFLAEDPAYGPNANEEASN